MKYVTFDLEIWREIPDGCDDIAPYRPLGITCAAICIVDDDVRVVENFAPHVLENGEYANSMSAQQCREMVDRLVSLYHHGYDIISWNGLGFDFDVLAEEVCDDEYANRVADLALHSVDPAFVMLCAKGYMIGLNTAAKGLGVEGKTEGMHGDLAPQMWRQGRAQQNRVIEYVEQDVIATANVYEAMRKLGGVKWTSRSGRLNYWNFPGGNFGVGEGLVLPEPDTSWMSNPRTRASVYAWTAKYLD